MGSLFSTMECRNLQHQCYLINSVVAHLLFIAELPLSGHVIFHETDVAFQFLLGAHRSAIVSE